MEDFVAKANDLGAQGRDFFYIIDFEKRMPFICPLDQLSSYGVSLYFRDFWSNFDRHPSSAHKLTLDLDPVMPSATRYRQGFDLVQREQNMGNSYLTNLTWPIPLGLPVLPPDIEAHIQAPFIVKVDDLRISPWPFICFSPESFVSIDGRSMTTRPIKGTARGSEVQGKRLMDSDKELAEHITLVDLLRNDLGQLGTAVRVEQFRRMFAIPLGKENLYQTESIISAQLDPQWPNSLGTILDRLTPAGSVSGAPKRSTCDIIARAEPEARGFYTGVAGIVLGNQMRSAVLIRYMEHHDSGLRFRSGGGITIYSSMEDEYRELEDKIGVPLL